MAWLNTARQAREALVDGRHDPVRVRARDTLHTPSRLPGPSVALDPLQRRVEVGSWHVVAAGALILAQRALAERAAVSRTQLALARLLAVVGQAFHTGRQRLTAHVAGTLVAPRPASQLRPTPSASRAEPHSRCSAQVVGYHQVDSSIAVDVGDGQPLGVLTCSGQLLGSLEDPAPGIAQEEVRPVRVADHHVHPPIAVHVGNRDRRRRLAPAWQ
mmetsp:Transcript_50317/g.118403  ORF Transcript_50317/g.118403 Transcript_50317/m.118403 type:complete len:215 (-) Transcript_50317:68-712(-)